MRLVKQAVAIGNGAAVYVPREYVGKEVVVTLPEGITEIKSRVLTALIECMPNIVGVYVYGSFARNEQELDSDVDILVVTKEKDRRIKEVLSGMDARVVPLNAAMKAIREYPVLIVPILREAVALLNPVLLEELKSKTLNIARLRWSLEEAKRTVRIIETFMGLDKAEVSATHLYSLLMRARVCVLIECLLKNKAYTTEKLKNTLFQHGFTKETVGQWLALYREVRYNRDVSASASREEIQALIVFLKKKLNQINHETRKAVEKRH